MRTAACCAARPPWPPAIRTRRSWSKTQRLPRPMEDARRSAAPGDDRSVPAGPEEVTVVRHADPVQVRLGGPLRRASRCPSSASGRASTPAPGCSCGAGGRAEVFWPNGTGRAPRRARNGSDRLGEPRRTDLLDCTARSRSDPAACRVTASSSSAARILAVERSRSSGPGDPRSRRLPERTAQDEASFEGETCRSRRRIRVGPIVVEHPRAGVLRVTNRWQGSATVSSAAESCVSSRVRRSTFRSWRRAGDHSRPTAVQTRPGRVEVRGEVEIVPGKHGDSLRALGEHEIRALGVRVRLDTARDGELLRPLWAAA